jgi:hypothetical protein
LVALAAGRIAITANASALLVVRWFRFLSWDSRRFRTSSKVLTDPVMRIESDVLAYLHAVRRAVPGQLLHERPKRLPFPRTKLLHDVVSAVDQSVRVKSFWMAHRLLSLTGHVRMPLQQRIDRLVKLSATVSRRKENVLARRIWIIARSNGP